MHSSKPSNEIKGVGGWEKHTKTLQKLKTPQPLHTVKLQLHVKAHT